MGSGIGNLDELYDSSLGFEQKVQEIRSFLGSTAGLIRSPGISEDLTAIRTKAIDQPRCGPHLDEVRLYSRVLYAVFQSVLMLRTT